MIFIVACAVSSSGLAEGDIPALILPPEGLSLRRSVSMGLQGSLWVSNDCSLISSNVYLTDRLGFGKVRRTFFPVILTPWNFTDETQKIGGCPW